MILDKDKVLFDTNVIIDIFGERIDKKMISLFFLSFDIKFYDFYIVNKQITDIYYILRKYTRDNNKRMKAIDEILSIFTMLELKNENIYKGKELKGKDFEDNILIANAIDNKIDFIVSNNKKDFEFCDEITTVDSSEFINLFALSLNQNS